MRQKEMMNNLYMYFRRDSLSPGPWQGPEPTVSRGRAVAVREGTALPALAQGDKQTMVSTQVLKIRGKRDLAGDIHKVS